MSRSRQRCRVFFLSVSLTIIISSTSMAQTRVEFHLLPAISNGPLDPEWSPDGESLVFAMRGDVWRISTSGGEAFALTGDAAGDPSDRRPVYYSEPAFSPDGEHIALTMDLDGNLEIGIVDAMGGEVERLTDHPEIDFAPVFSADGESLYFVTRRNGNLDIFRYDLDSKRETPVVVGQRNDFQPAVSQDGRRLAYVAPVDGRSGSGGIWVKPLPDGEAKLVHYEESSYRMKPQWSFDGASLTYVTDAAGTNDIAVVPVTGGNRVRLTEAPRDEFDPAVSPDGSQIAFVSNQRGLTGLFVSSSTGGARGDWMPVEINTRRPRFPTGRVRGRVLGPEGNVVPARIMLVASDGRGYTEENSFHRMVPATRTHYQHTGGEFDIEVPAGRVVLEAMRGFEFLPDRAEIEVRAGSIEETDLELKRITPPGGPGDGGWVSGDMHVHDLHEGRFGLDQEGFFHQLAADGVQVSNALIHMDGTKLMGRFDDLTGAPYRLSNEGTILRYSQEFRGSFGHVALVGLKQFIMPFIGGAAHTPYAPDVLKIRHIDAVHEQGGIAGFVHPYNHAVTSPRDAASADIPVHVALGKGDFYDVISVASLEEDSTRVYYKFLNSGFRLAATGGTDNFSDVWYDPSGGAARTYARLDSDGPLTFESWIDAVRKGRTFATSGPLLFLRVDGKEPGDEIRLDGSGAGTLEVELELSSIAPVSLVEILVNGEVVRSFAPEGAGPSWSFRESLELEGSGWIAAKAIGKPNRFVGDAYPFAQTSPIYVVRDGKTYSSVEDALFLLEAVDELWSRVEKRDTWNTADQKRIYRDGIDEARDVYRRVILRHPEHEIFSARAPESFRVRFETSKGPIVTQIHRAWSPKGVDRFYNLVRFGYFDGAPFFRVRENDFAQFGIHGEPEISQAWRGQFIPDEPVKENNVRGRLGFAHGFEDNDRTTQLFIALKDKPELDEMGFSPIGDVVSGMEAADALYSGYGENAGGGIRGGKQDSMFERGAAHFAEYPELDAIRIARIVSTSAEAAVSR